MENYIAAKKKVLLVVRWPVGGIRTFLRYVYRNFDPGDWRFTILAPDVIEMRTLVDDLACHDIVFRPIKGMPTDGTSGIWRLFHSVLTEIAQNNYDMVHSHGFISGMSAAIPAFLWRIPHLLTSHDVIHESQLSGFKGRLRRFLMGVSFELIDKVHSVSHDAQANLLCFFPGLAAKKQKCIVIPNGIEVERFFKAEPRNLRAELNLGNDVYLIGFMGRFMAQKGFRYLVDAIEILCKEDVFLPKRPLVLSFGDGGYLKEEKQAIKDRGLRDSFVFMPFTPNVSGTIKGLDVLAMPSLWEACGLLAMEGLVCGIPLIASNCIGLREVTENTPVVKVKPKDGCGLAEAIKMCIYEDTKEIFVNFAGQACDRYDVRKQYHDLNVLYRKMCA